MLQKMSVSPTAKIKKSAVMTIRPGGKIDSVNEVRSGLRDMEGVKVKAAPCV
jgi:hypothetical protein